MERNEAIKRIKTALESRSHRKWSVTGGRGTTWGWLTITAPPKMREDGAMTPADCRALADLLGMDRPVHPQGENVPASTKDWEWYIARAEGRKAGPKPEPYWD